MREAIEMGEVTKATQKIGAINSATPFVHHQNLVRGAISRFRSKGYKRSASEATQALRMALASTNLKARTELLEPDFEPYLDWLADVVGTTVPELRIQPVGYDFLGGFASKRPRTTIRRELIWIAQRIAHESAILDAFVSKAQVFQDHCLAGKYELAIATLTDITSSFGQSYWAVQVRIALEHAVGGLEQQKRFTDEVRKQFRRGLLSYVAYYTSVRNEDRTTLPRFVEMIEQRLAKTKYDADVRTYLRYRLFGAWPESSSGVADILRLEQNHSIIDVYETFVGALQLMASQPEFEGLRSDVTDALALLGRTRDYRIAKLRYALRLDDLPTTLELRSQHLSDALFERNATKVIRTPLAPPARADPWQIVYSSLGCAHADAQRSRKVVPTDYRPLLASIFRRDEGSISNLGLLAKNTLNWSALPVALSIHQFCRTLRNASARSVADTAALSLNSPTFGIEDVGVVGSPLSAAAFPQTSPTTEFWLAFSIGKPSATLDADFRDFALARHAYSLGDCSTAVALLETANADLGSPPFDFLRASLELAARIELSDHGGAIRLIADQASSNERCPAFLPVIQALGHLRWPDFKSQSADLSGAIALDALWRTTENDAVATTLRFAFSYQLRNSGFARPSEFADQPESFNQARLVYFLRNICVPSIMDMSNAFKTSREVYEERQAVCGALTALDPEHSTDYQAEIYTITNRHAVADGLRLVDASRIHVDTDAIVRWSRRRLEEDFRRYSDLVRAGIGEEGDFNEILREVFATIGARQMYFTPDDQADAILADVFFRLRSEFLGNSDYGLDYFLSKRVRHQSFIGLARGPLEFQNLITTRETESGAYRSNTVWLDRLRTLTPDQRTQVDMRLAKFSEDFDASLITIKDEAFQIRSEDRPNGLFDVPITTRMLFVVRSVAQAGIAFDDFLRMALHLLWAGLEPSLEAARRLIKDDLKPRLAALFDELKKDLKIIADCDPSFPDMSMAIGDVSVNVQRNLDEAAGWFVRPEGQQANYTFTMSQSVDIAVQSALKSHRAFSPELELNASGEATLNAPDLLLLTDAIFVAIDNAKAHCGIKRDPHVSIDCRIDPATERLMLDVRNSVAPGVRTPAVEKKLDRIREVIATGTSYSGARREGGSGFVKIAAALRHSAEGQMQFGFESDGEFRMQLSFRPTQFTVAVIRA